MEIIIKPVLTEKMTALTDKQHKVAFIVAEGANKIEIKKAVEPSVIRERQNPGIRRLE